MPLFCLTITPLTEGERMKGNRLKKCCYAYGLLGGFILLIFPQQTYYNVLKVLDYTVRFIHELFSLDFIYIKLAGLFMIIVYGLSLYFESKGERNEKTIRPE